MATTPEVQGSFKLKINDNEYLCARDISFGGSAEQTNVSCAASGNVTETRRGRKSYTLSASSIIRVATGTDIPTQVTSATLEAAFEAGTIFPWEFGTDTPGATVKSGDAYVLNFTESAPFEGEPTFDVEFAVTGPVVYTVNPI